MFQAFKKLFVSDKENHKTDYEITDLEVGFVFDYNLESWTVSASYEYDWGEEDFSREYKITNGKSTMFLHVDDGDKLEIILNTKCKLRDLGQYYDQIITAKQEVNQLEFKGESYWMEERSPGYYNEIPSDEWTELISTTYYNELGDKVLTLEQWGEDEFELSSGILLKPFEISNILPAA